MWWSLGSLSNDDHDVNENGKKAPGWYYQNTNFTRASRFVEDGNTRQQFSFSLTELWYSSLELNSEKLCQHLTNWTTWNKRDKVWSSANSLFKWRFGSRRHRCCLKSLISHGGGGEGGEELLQVRGNWCHALWQRPCQNMLRGKKSSAHQINYRKSQQV